MSDERTEAEREMNGRCIAHAFHTTRSDNRAIARSDALSGEDNAFQSAGTDLVDGGRIGAGLQTSQESNLPCGGLTHAGLDDVAEVYLLYECRIYLF